MDIDPIIRTCAHVGDPAPRALVDVDASDAALVAAIADRHEGALEILYRRHGGASYALARRVLWDRAAAEEVVQDVFVRLWTGHHRFDPERGSLRGLLLMWTHRGAVDALRRNESRTRREQKHADRVSGPHCDIEEEVIDLRLAEFVEETLSSLREDQRRVIELAYLDGLTYREVATYLRRPEGTVKTWIRSALRDLRADRAAELLPTEQTNA